MKPILLTPHARLQVLEAEDWWLANRDKSPFLFETELEHVLNLLSEQPDLGQEWENPRIPGLRRILLQKSLFHIYYVNLPDHVRVIGVWGGIRGKQPEFGSDDT